MKHVIAILVILFLTLLWCLPCYMMLQPESGKGWGVLYVAVAPLTVLWGIVMNNTYFKH